MLISLKWLSDYIDIKNLPVSEIVHALTGIGLEVEGVNEMSRINGDVVVGEIVAAEKHPDADTLRVCQVNVGRGEALEIVCGAPNARAGIKVATALVGSCLPGDFKIKKSKIRGVTSNGMLCSEMELGLSSDHNQIIELSENATIGSSIADLLRLRDHVLTLSITPNRGDALSYIGVARDLSAKLGIPLKTPKPPLLQQNSQPPLLKIQIENHQDCARFVGLKVNNIIVQESPAWLKERLEWAGMRPVNNIVDISNYVMLEWGQPTHAYDARNIKDQTLIARRARASENQFKTLDGQLRALTTSDLVISDTQSIVGIAGVMGGQDSEVKSDTTEIILEAAAFDPSLVRKTSKRLGLHSEASHRFERGCDVNNLPTIVSRLVELLQHVAKELGLEKIPSAQSQLMDVGETRKTQTPIALRLSRARHVLGLSTINPTQVVEKFNGLGLKLVDQTPDRERLLFEIPSWRHDLNREIDLIEELARLIGYDAIPSTMPVLEVGVTSREHPMIRFVDQAKAVFAAGGMTEVITFPFTNEERLNQFLIPQGHVLRRYLRLKNPLAENTSLLRTYFIDTLVEVVLENRRRGAKGVRLFECGRIYSLGEQSETSSDIRENSEKNWTQLLQIQGQHISVRAKADRRAIEQNRIAGVIDQPWQDKTWQNAQMQAATIYHAGEIISRAFSALGVGSYGARLGAVEEVPYLHPAQNAYVLCAGKIVGYLGALHPKLAKNLDFDPDCPPIVFEMNLDELFLISRSKNSQTQIAEDSKFPPVSLDFAFVVDAELSFEQLAKALHKFPQKRNLKSFDLFDVYEGDRIEAGKKSLALSFSFQSTKRTLTDKEVEAEVDLLKQWLKSEVNAQLRA